MLPEDSKPLPEFVVFFRITIIELIWIIYFLCVNSSKKRFSSPYRHYCDLVDSLARQVIEYHTQLLVSSLLNDSESHDWSSNKEFYEVSTQHIVSWALIQYKNFVFTNIWNPIVEKKMILKVFI